MVRTQAAKFLGASAVTGWTAFFCTIAAVAIPTAVRAALNGVVTGCEFTPYLPFVLVSAIMLRWWQASLVAIAGVAIMGGVFEGSLLHPMACFVPAAGMFVASSAAMIALAALARRWLASFLNHDLDEAQGGVVFSLEKGEVWVSWYGQGSPLRLGSQAKVSSMMRDYLAQEELGKRLSAKHARAS